MNANAWVKKAIVSKKKGRGRTSLQKKGLDAVYHGNGMIVGTDNCRAHLWFDKEITDAGDGDYPLEKVLSLNSKARGGIEVCEFSTYSLKKACTAALAYFKKNNKYEYIPNSYPFIYVYANKDQFEIAMTRAEVGSMHFALQNGDTWKLKKTSHDLFYNYRLKSPTHFYVNPVFFRQALEGMEKSATLRITNNNMLHMTGENGAEALVMCLNFEDFEKYHLPYSVPSK
jgi:hypothetical protein